MQYMVETKNLRKVYRTGDEKVVALDNIDLTSSRGRCAVYWVPPAVVNPPC